MGTHPEQVLTLIGDFPKAKFYLLSVKTSNIKIKELPTNIEWAMLIAYHRGRMEKIKGTAYYEKYHTFFNQHDMVIGSIANDKMFQVLDDFFIGNITDTVLINCLAALNLGKQYVAITQKGCEAIQIEQEIHISSSERKSLQDISEKIEQKGYYLLMKSTKNTEEVVNILTRSLMRQERSNLWTDFNLNFVTFRDVYLKILIMKDMTV